MISLEMVEKEALLYERSKDDQLLILLIHGLLHLLGYDHARSPREAVRMQRREKFLFKKLAEEPVQQSQFVLRQACPENAGRFLRQAQDKRPAYRRAQHERKKANVFTIKPLRPEPFGLAQDRLVEACGECIEPGERRICRTGSEA
ncbi:MAG: rRNA maturation RNase YbeY [Nitrospiria bacterium]